MKKKKTNNIKLVPVKILPTKLYYSELNSILDAATRSKNKYIRIDGISRWQAANLRKKMQEHKLKMTVKTINNRPFIIKNV